MRSTDPYDKLTSSRRSRFYYTDMINDEPLLQKRLGDRYGSGFYEHMFLEDVSRILPYGRGVDEGFHAVVTSTDQRASDLIRNALPSQYGPPRTLEDRLRELVEHSAQLILLESAVYEIDYLYATEDQDGRPVAFRLEALQPGSVDALDGQPIQYVPAQASSETTADGLHFVRLDPEQMITIRLDSHLEQAVRAAMTVFAAADRQQSTPVTMLEQGQHTSTGFDFAAHRAETGRVLLAATHELGWTGRGLFSDGALDPYVVWRHLRFLRFKIAVRDTILAGLSRTILQAGQALDFEATVTLPGLLSAADIEQAEADLQTGHRPLADLIKLGV